MMTKKQYIQDNFSIRDLKRLGFFTTEKTYEEYEKRICTYFGLKNIFMWDFIMSDKSETLKADIKTFSEN